MFSSTNHREAAAAATAVVVVVQEVVASGMKIESVHLIMVVRYECSQMIEVAKWDARHARAAMAWQHLAITSQKKSSLSSTMQGWQELDVTSGSKVNVLPLQSAN